MRIGILLFGSVFVAGCAGGVSTAPAEEDGRILEVTPASIAFAARPAQPGMGVETVPVRLRNAGDGTVTILEATLDPPGAFSVSGSFPLEVGSTGQNLPVRFDPALGGPASSVLRLLSDDEDRTIVEIPISTGNGPAPQIACTPDPIALEAAPGTTVAREVRCTNAGSTPVQVESVAVDGAGFAVLFFSGPALLQPGDSLAPFTITWTAGETGETLASLRLRATAFGDLPFALLATSTTTPSCTHAMESFTQPGPPVDVLFVIESYSTMSNDLDAVVSSLYSFTSRLLERGVAFQLGFVRTDYQNGGKLLGSPAVLGPATPNVLQQVFDRASVTTSNSWYYSYGLLNAYRAVTEPYASAENAGFLRPEARLELVFLSDREDDSSYEPGYYETAFEILKGGSSMVSAHAVVGGGPPACASASEAGARYRDLAFRLGGAIASICDDDFGAALHPIADISGRYRFPLGVQPAAGTMLVKVGGVPQAPGSDWTWADGSVVFAPHALPAPGKTIHVEYDTGCLP